jgi:hypothetical protein
MSFATNKRIRFIAKNKRADVEHRRSSRPRQASFP